MFGLFKRKKPYEQESIKLYEAVHGQSRDTVFYDELGVPDTTEGRFGVLTLHMFIVMHCVQNIEGGDHLSQSLFDVAFEDIDRGYREIGVGDMGIPKRMKKLMLGFNGAIHAYEESLKSNEALKEAIRRNVYTLDTDEENSLDNNTQRLADYTQANIHHLQNHYETAIMKGDITFLSFDEIK